MNTTTSIPKVTRRLFSQVLIAGLCAPTGVLASTPSSVPIRAVFVRSGKIHHSGADNVLLGAMVMSEDEYRQLESELAALDDEMNFRREVKFATTRLNDDYFEAALPVLGKRDADFSIVILKPANWGGAPDTFEMWRRDAELAALRHLVSDHSVSLETLKHDKNIDSSIYPQIQSEHGNLDSIRLHQANEFAPRPFQVANIISKCIGQAAMPEEKRTQSPVKARMVKIASDYYDLPPVVDGHNGSGLSVQVLPIF